jgi:hypothetical protein
MYKNMKVSFKFPPRLYQWDVPLLKKDGPEREKIIGAKI